MTVSFIFGNLLGRAALSYMIVLLLCWCGSRFRWRAALARSVRWYSLLGVVLLVLLGVGASVSRFGGIG